MISTETGLRVIRGILAAESSTYTNHPADRGGPTKYGITLATLRDQPGYGHAAPIDIQKLTEDQATEIYLRIYAAPYKALSNEAIFEFVVNGAVQHGVRGMNKIIQRAVKTDVDGVLGTRSWREIQSLEQKDPVALLAGIVAERCGYYANILSSDHSQRVFAAGWFNRIAKDLK